MKGLILALTFAGGIFGASNDQVQDFAKGAFDKMRGHQQVMDITEEQQELLNYRIDLYQEYDWDNMVAEEVILAKAEIRVLVEEKALELGVELPEKAELSEEQIAIREYYHELLTGYDWANLTEEELEAARAEVKELMTIKAEELGIEIPAGPSEEMIELLEYAKELKDSYDWENMTEEEIELAKEEIRTLVEEKAEELGVDLDEIQKKFKRRKAQEKFNRFHKRAHEQMEKNSPTDSEDESL